MAKGLATSCFDQAAALLRSASSTAARAAGATFAGGSRDGGAISNGGESNSSLFRSLGRFVNVVPGGFWGGETIPCGGGDSFGRGENTAPGDGAASMAQGGATILGSGSGLVSLERSEQQGPITRGRGLGFNLNPTSREGRILSPPSFQPGKASVGVTSVSLGGISLKGLPEERPPGGGRPLKMFSLLKFEGPSSLGICGGVIGGGGHFCVRQAAACDYTSHRTKTWEARFIEAGMYILDEGMMKAYLEPCHPMEDATRLATGKAVLEDGEQTMEA